MRHLFRLGCLLALTSACLAKEGTGVLTLVDEPGFNEIELTVGVSGINDSDVSTLSGTGNATLVINALTDEVHCLTLAGGSASGTPISLDAGGVFAGFAVTSSVLSGFVETPDPPVPVDSATGEFDATKIDFVLDSGVLIGESTILFQTSPIAADLSEEPFRGSGDGLGTISLTETASTATSKTYDVVLLSGILVDSVLELDGLNVDVDANGTLKATGSVTVDFPNDFDLWTFANDVPCWRFENDDNNDGVPSGLHWALGLTAGDDPSDAVLQPVGPGGGGYQFELTLPPGGSVADIVVEGTTAPNSTPFAPLASATVSAGNPIPAGTSGTVTVTCPGPFHFLRLSVTAP